MHVHATWELWSTTSALCREEGQGLLEGTLPGGVEGRVKSITKNQSSRCVPDDLFRTECFVCFHLNSAHQ